MKITIETIPHDQQRYPTCGDYFKGEGDEVIIRVSEMGDWRYEAAVAIHELTECFLLLDNPDATAADVDAFDMAYQGDGEPGDDPASPYRDEHCFATAVERLLIAALGVSWSEYAAAVEALP